MFSSPVVSSAPRVLLLLQHFMSVCITGSVWEDGHRSVWCLAGPVFPQRCCGLQGSRVQSWPAPPLGSGRGAGSLAAGTVLQEPLILTECCSRGGPASSGQLGARAGRQGLS